MAEAPLPLLTRFWFAWACFFKVLLDGELAARFFSVRDGMPLLPPPPEAPVLPAKAAEPAKVAEPEKRTAEPEALAAEAKLPAKAPEPKPEPEKPSVTAALQLLALFQREGRLIDFLEQDVASYSDADVGAAARVVHEGCRKALRQHAKLGAVRSEEEGAAVTIEAGYDAHQIKLVGNVQGKPPYKGVLRHKGWRLRDLTVATPTKDHDATVVAPAEVEL